MTESDKKEKPLGTIHEIPLDQINISEENVRHIEAVKDLDELAASIKRHGLLQPIVLMGEYGKPPYELISGQRRFLAHQTVLKASEIKAVFVGKLSKVDAVVRSLVENLQRVELDYKDTAEAVTFLYTKLDKDEKKVQKETGLSLQKIREYILIESRATPKMKDLLRQGKVSAVDLKRSIRAAQDNLKKAEELIELIIKLKPTSHQRRRIIMYGEKDKGASAEKIIKEAMKPHVEQNIMINLPEEIREALVSATEKLSMEPEELAAKVLGDWLKSQGFVS